MEPTSLFVIYLQIHYACRHLSEVKLDKIGMNEYMCCK